MNIMVYLLVLLGTLQMFAQDEKVYSCHSENNGIALMNESDLLIYSVGISTGGLAEIRMAKLNPARKIIATTIDVQGADFAKKHIEQNGLSEQVIVKLEDVTKDLLYPNELFDFIYARLILHYLPREDLKNCLNQLYRILKPKGKFFIVVRSTKCVEANSEFSTYDPSTGLTTYISTEGKSYSRYFHTEESIQEYLIEAGFTIEKVQSYKEQLCIDFQRTKLSNFVDDLIEVTVSKGS